MTKSEEQVWLPEGGETVVSSLLIEIDELVGEPDIDLRLGDSEQRFRSLIFELSGKIAVTGTLGENDAARLLRLMQADPPKENPEARLISTSNGSKVPATD